MPEEKPVCGLRSGKAAVPLVGVSIDAQLRHLCARVVVTQRYRNDEAGPIEAVYVFPLEEGAAVCAFEAIVDGVHVVGEVKEREKAFEAYDDALARGHGAYLLDQERPDVFTASIGNVPPGKEVLVRVTYVAELALEGGDLRFALPTTVSPRYAPAEDQRGVGRSPADAVNPPVAWRVPYGLTLSVDIEMLSAIRSVESPSHPISVELDGLRAAVRLGARESALDSDFVLKVRLAEPHAPHARVEADASGRHVALVCFQPVFDVAEAPSEVIFVVDRSGSMQGTSIAEARNALQLCLRSLGPGTRLNIVGFGDRFETLFPESRLYSDEVLARASDHVAGLQADMGGTEILPALEAILETKPDPDLPRQLFVLTDGQVSNTQAVLKLVREHSDTARVFTFGIGAGASQHLVRGMARAGGGDAEFIAPGERIEGKVLRQLQKALTPALTDVRLDWGGLEVVQAPARVPPAFAGGRVLVYAFIERFHASNVTLSARSPSGPVSFTLRLEVAEARGDGLIATLAARTMIRDLEEGSSLLHDRRGSLQERGSKDRVKDEIVRLGVSYGLCSRETSFVAIEKRETPVQGEAQLRRIPVALTRGWGGLDEATATTGAFPAMVLYSAMPSAMPAEEEMEVGMDLGAEEGIARFAPAFELKTPHATPRAAPPQARAGTPPPAASSRPLDLLVRLQSADGSWELSAELARAVGRSLADLEGLLAGAAGDPAQARKALATAVAIVWLEMHAADAKDEWLMLANKARKWLGSCAARAAGGKDWLGLAGESSKAPNGGSPRAGSKR